MRCLNPGPKIGPKNPLARTLTGLLVVGAVALTGCSSTSTTTDGTPTSGSVAPAVVGVAEVDLEQYHIIGPTAARQLGYRFDWQTNIRPSGNSGVRRMTVQGDSVFVLDGQNFLTRLDRADGSQLWRISVADAISSIEGIDFVPEFGRVYVTTDTDVFALDATTGSLADRQPLSKIAHTDPVIAGQHLIYGARNGEIVWHDYSVGYQLQAYGIGETVELSPVLVGSVLVCIGVPGRVTVLSAVVPSMIWQKQLLSNVKATPAAGAGMVLVADMDQTLWGIDMLSGRTIWKRLTRSPLTDSPVIIDDRVYQRVEADGLLCLEASPVDAPNGVVHWTASDVSGNVVNRAPNHLMTWDDSSRTMALVDPRNGILVDEVSLPAADSVVFPRMQGGDLFAVAADGRIIRLVPR